MSPIIIRCNYLVIIDSIKCYLQVEHRIIIGVSEYRSPFHRSLYIRVALLHQSRDDNRHVLPTLQSEVIRLMPTIQGSPASHVYLRLLLPNGTLQEYDITAPAMKVGGKYELRLNYNQMQPKMNLEATINGWTNLNNEVEIK